MGTPENYHLKGYVDHSLPGQIETLHKATFSSKEEVLTSSTLSPEDVFILVERLHWASISGNITHHLEEGASKVILKYPFSQFWEIITDSFAIAQYSNEYGIAFQHDLKSKLKLESLNFPNFIRIILSAHSIGEEFDSISIPPHNADIGHFECRADIISHAAYIEGMLYKIITDSKKTTYNLADKMTYNRKIDFCEKEKLLSNELLSIVKLLKDLRNQAAHQFSFEKCGPTGNYLKINPVSDKLLEEIKSFVCACEKRYSLKEGRINRFDNVFRMLAGELNAKANLAQMITLGKQYPAELSSYFYG